MKKQEGVDNADPSAAALAGGRLLSPRKVHNDFCNDKTLLNEIICFPRVASAVCWCVNIKFSRSRLGRGLSVKQTATMKERERGRGGWN